MANPLPNLEPAIQQLYPSLSLRECNLWLQWLATQPHYHIDTIGEATCITKVFNQEDPPWLRVAQEVAWWGHGRDVVRVLHRGMADGQEKAESLPSLRSSETVIVTRPT